MRQRTDAYRKWAREHAAKVREVDPAKHRAQVKKSRIKRLSEDPTFYKRNDLKKLYGVTLEWYESVKAAQKHACAICGKPETENTVRLGKPLALSVDHCHDTGKVRGLLCNNCNRAIGMLEHSIETLNSAIAYLAAYERNA